jgi:superfamily II RNA helicase
MSKYLKIADVRKGPTKLADDPPITYSFPLDPFQQHAMNAICAEENVLVTAKTGSGKTLVGEIQIAQSLRKGKRVFYTTPIKSLSNQKFHDLKKQFGSVGIMTGDIKFCPDASVVIMTTEILRNLLFKKGSTTEALGITADISCAHLDAVVFDECHYINDKDRGHVWEEVMILLPPDVKLVMLSATLDKPEYFALWLGELKQRPVNLISTEYRIVPLTHTLWYGGQSHILMDSSNIYSDKVYKDWLDWLQRQELGHAKFQEKVRDARLSGTKQDGPIAGKTRPVSFLHRMNELINSLDERKLLPALFFVLSRKDCEKYAQKVESTLITSSETADVRHIWDFHLRHHKATLEKLPQYYHLWELVQRGIAFHHSGLVPMLKEIIEILFGRGLIKALFATETFAVGINMPTKTAVFIGLKKYDEEKEGMRMLNTAEYLQMAGRAGRRGLDTMGTVIYLPDRDPVEQSEMKAMMCGGKAPVVSRMEFDYDFILKTIQSGNRTWLDLLEQSYWRQQRKVLIGSIQAEITQLTDRAKLLELSEEEVQAFDERSELEIQFRESSNSKRKKAELAIKRWNDDHSDSKWVYAKRKSAELSEVNLKLKVLNLDMKIALDVSCDVEARIKVLEVSGFLKPLDDPKAHTKNSLTLKGVLATELNESDALLVSQFYLLDFARTLEPMEVIAILSSCIYEGKKKDEEPAIDDIDVPKVVKEGLYELNDIWHDLRKAETTAGSKESKWKLSTFWVGPMWRWMQGESVAQLCADYGVYEGNLIRSVMKLQNMLDEWRSMATYCEHTAILDKFRTAHELILRDAVIQDSLYLRL